MTLRPTLRARLFAAALAMAVASPALAQKVQTTDQANREDLKGAAAAPLRDLNVVRTEVPEVLLLAKADPYRRPKNNRCDTLIAEILPLDVALGQDLDDPTPAAAASAKDKGKSTVLGAVAGAASDVIPFRGLVRKATGAEDHDRFVQDAITAGLVRRAYLKGLGESHGCNPPATPSHLKDGTPVVEDGKPRYPIR